MCMIQLNLIYRLGSGVKVDPPVGNGFFWGSIHPMTEIMGFLEPRIVKRLAPNSARWGVASMKQEAYLRR